MPVGHQRLYRLGIALVEEYAPVLGIFVKGHEYFLRNGVNELFAAAAEVGKLQLISGLRIIAYAAYLKRICRAEGGSVNNAQRDDSTVGTLRSYCALHPEGAEPFRCTVADILRVMSVIILIGLSGIFGRQGFEAFVYLRGRITALWHENGRGHVRNVIIARFRRHFDDHIAAAASGICVYYLVILRHGDVDARLIGKIIDEGLGRKDVELLIVDTYAVLDIGAFGALGLVSGEVKVNDASGLDGGLVRIFK